MSVEMMTSPYHLLCTVATAFQESGQGGKNKEPRNLGNEVWIGPWSTCEPGKASDDVHLS